MEKEAFQGQQIEVIALDLSADKSEATLMLKAFVNKNIMCICFHNVSNLTINSFSSPFQIEGLEICDNKPRGWENSMRYTIYDFECQVIKFNCEDFEIL